MNENKLIAEFMELETSDECYFEHLTKKGNTELTHHILLQYHISWDWLMPVVEKIEQVNEGVPHQLLNISLFSSIDEVYQAVIEFIESYE